MGNNVLLIAHQIVFIPTLDHTLLITIQMILHAIMVNKTPTLRCLKTTNLSHYISVRGDNVDEVQVITFDLHGVVYCFPSLKPSQEEFETCDRYEMTYENPEYEPSDTTFHDQKAGITDSWGNLKATGEFHPKRRQVCSLLQKEAEIKLISSRYSDISTN
jgi:hypothetical protein